MTTAQMPAAQESLASQSRPLLGIMLKVISAMIFTVMVALIKLVSETMPAGEIVFARSFFGLFPVVVMVAMRRELTIAFSTTRPFTHLGRSFVGVTAMFMWFSALQYLQLPDATAISYGTPLITVVLAYFILKESVRAYRWTAVGVGFLGILVILSPGLTGGRSVDDGLLFGSVLALTSTFFMAFAMVFVRSLIKSERTSTVVFWFSASSSFFALFTIPFGWVIPDLTQAIILVSIGLIGGVGQILLTQSYRYADASTIAPFDYTSMIWAVALGWFMFGEVPQWQVIAGAVIVMSAGIFVIYREHALGIDRTKARRASSPSKG
ncbi:MAG: DMT family transporter [Stappiaceae bacterium]